MSDNIKPIQSTAEAREKGRKGGIASGRKRREKRLFKELLEAALAIEQTNSKGERKSLKDISMVNLAAKAAKGDMKAIELAAKLLGEYTQKTDITSDGEKLDLTINLK